MIIFKILRTVSNATLVLYFHLRNLLNIQLIKTKRIQIHFSLCYLKSNSNYNLTNSAFKIINSKEVTFPIFVYEFELLDSIFYVGVTIVPHSPSASMFPWLQIPLLCSDDSKSTSH